MRRVRFIVGLMVFSLVFFSVSVGFATVRIGVIGSKTSSWPS